MNEISVCSHAELEERLQVAAAESGAAESHGLLCGMICAGNSTPPDRWLAHLLGEENTLSAAARDCSNMLTTLHTEALRQLHGEALDFQLLLPDDDMPLALRAGELAAWCQGFLFGLGLGGLRGEVEYPETIGEVMRDFYEIANARFDYESADEEDEAAYIEIVEYVRMSVLLLHAELQPVPVSARLQ